MSRTAACVAALAWAALAACTPDALPCVGSCGDPTADTTPFAAPPGEDATIIVPVDARADSLVRGQPCAAPSDCAPGLVCNFGVKPAECRPPSAAGEPCGLDTDCQPGLGCSSGSLICKPLSRRDQPCTRVRCGPGLICNHARDIAVCRPLGEEGEPCADSAECIAELGCNRGMSPPVCLPPAPAGARCWAEEDCAGLLLCDHRDPTPTCKERGTAGLGEPCLWHGDCRPDLKCGNDDKCHYP